MISVMVLLVYVIVVVITVKDSEIVVDIMSSEMVVPGSVVVVVVITVGDSEVVVDEYEVFSSALEGVSEMSELASSDEVSEVEPKVEKLVSVDSFGVVVGRFDCPCPVDGEASEDDDASVDNDTPEPGDASADDVALVLDSLEKIDDSMGMLRTRMPASAGYFREG
ncbi:hypothetical protein J7337_004966 [Fusarium musae]|uniref:Uncharacterized protein n=1 Tax=Fusarium musae TaxID=1042133 RepID=A0A9P8DI43_9HYPO|nr:hypothetical protein J7337_004966 [Fusarium musae]KAG9502141.1 hypothetical protein J7337_004966 [Fusarium musae]